MSFPSGSFIIEVSKKRVFIVDPHDKDCRVEVDQVVFDTTSFTSATRGRGKIVAVHGLPQDLAQILPGQMLKELGVGRQFTPSRPPNKGRRMRATAEGIEYAS